ncbi:hypothetical protein [Mycoplasma sp. 21DD0573]|uniref:hypothetical protein n=1 Tax=unclassified Mycoplasma TaxID=2683645 RepID=UPI002B1E4B7C|nr:hypothetical protein [Mycoplasma sp. 21DD0573]MEA4276548.1 hypothetical protein [Mycoplasma sp. 21DD0573]
MINQTILKSINDSAKLNKLNHLFLLTANSNYNFDKDLLDFINNINPTRIAELDKLNLPSNIYYLDGSEEPIKKEEFENVFNEVSYSSNFDKYKIVIIKNIENSSLIALNSLLKSIEEPSDKVVIIMTTNNVNNVLPTILSRAQVLKVDILSPEIIEEKFASLKNDPTFSVVKMLSNDLTFLTEASEHLDKYKHLIAGFIIATRQSLLNKIYMFEYLDRTIVNKDNDKDAHFVLSLLKAFILGKFLESQTLPLHKELNKLRQELLEKRPNLLTFIVDLDDFNNSKNFQGNFELHKQLLLNKLMEYYG